jgi:TrmH family RNA methyltransferase
VAKHLDNLHKSDTIDERLFITGRLFLLEGIRDPGNLGTILRTSNAMGTDIVVLSDDCADVYNSKTIRASMGAVFRQKTYRTTKLPSFIKELREKGILIYAAALDHDSVDVRTLDTNSNASLCFAVGNEGHGLSHEVISACNGKVMIPMSPECESLNAAIACSILLWEQAKHSL